MAVLKPLPPANYKGALQIVQELRNRLATVLKQNSSANKTITALKVENQRLRGFLDYGKELHQKEKKELTKAVSRANEKTKKYKTKWEKLKND